MLDFVIKSGFLYLRLGLRLTGRSGSAGFWFGALLPKLGCPVLLQRSVRITESRSPAFETRAGRLMPVGPPWADPRAHLYVLNATSTPYTSFVCCGYL